MRKPSQETSYARIVDTPAITKSLVLICAGGSLAISIAYWVNNGIQETSLSLLILFFICLLLLLLTIKGFSELAAFLLYLVVSIVLTFNISIGHAVYDEAMLAYPLLIVISGLIFGKRAAVLVTTITILQISLIQILANRGHVQPFGGAVPLIQIDSITTSIILASTGLLIYVVTDLVEKAVGRIVESEKALEDSYTHTLSAWARALELRERESPGHSSRVTEMAVRLASEIGMDPEEIKQIRLGALLHDIGKMGIPERILLKESALNPSEMEILREHPRMGAKIIDGIDYLQGAMDIILSHHERYDSSGFPREIGGDELSYPSQIFAIVDCWDMLRADRPCRRAITDSEAIQFIQDQKGKKFNPEIVEVFLSLIQQPDQGVIGT